MGWFDLPSRWVYVWYEGGKMENVANTDTLTPSEAESYKERWEAARKKRVVRITLENNKGDVIRDYHYR